MLGSREWVLLAYRLPREPSMPRIALWRRLRRLGAVQLVDGLVVLPASPKTRERLDWLAEGAQEAGGEASVWLVRPASARVERELVARISSAAAADYAAVVEEARIALTRGDAGQRRTVARLRRELMRIGQRDYFPPPERERARAAVEALVRDVPVAMSP